MRFDRGRDFYLCIIITQEKAEEWSASGLPHQAAREQQKKLVRNPGTGDNGNRECRPFS
jgi:hypothetical protein